MLKRRGFTLIELLISSALGAVIVAAVLYSLFAVFKFSALFAARIDSLESMRASTSRIVMDIRNSGGILSSSTREQLDIEVFGEQVSYDALNGKIRRRAGASSSYLTEEGRIASLNFYYSGEKLVKIELGVLRRSGALKLVTTEALARN